MTLEDETGIANIVVWPKVMEKFRKEVMGSAADRGAGDHSEQPGQGVHLVAERLFDRSHELMNLANDALGRKHPIPAGCGYHRATGRRTEGSIRTALFTKYAIRAMSVFFHARGIFTDTICELCWPPSSASMMLLMLEPCHEDRPRYPV